MAEQEQGNATWLVGAVIDSDDVTQRFVQEGIWHRGGNSSPLVPSMQPGDRIAIKSAYTCKHDVPFDNHGKPVSTMRIKARGTVTAIESDHVTVNWDPSFTEREWYLYTNRRSVWKIPTEDDLAADLAKFVFEDEPQDYAKFLAEPLWQHYASADDAEPTIGLPQRGSFRSAAPTVQHVYQAADLWRSAIAGETSLFSGQPLDYNQALAALQRYFVDNPDEGEGTFLGKLEGQLSGAPDSAVQLTAELLYVYFLPVSTGAVGATSKATTVETVAGWRDGCSGIPNSLAEALRTGIARPGTAYHTLRYRHFEFLISVLQDLMSRAQDQRYKILHSWQDFDSLLGSSETSASMGMRHMLAHLLFPDNFQGSASDKNLRTIEQVFQERLGADVTIHDLPQYLPANITYGDNRELNLFLAPHRYEWDSVPLAARIWAAWLAVIIENGPALTGPDHRDSGRRWLETILEPAVVDELTDEAASYETAQFIDRVWQRLGEQRSEIDHDELLQAASSLVASVDPRVPVRYADSARRIESSLPGYALADAVTPGERYMRYRERLVTMQYALADELGEDLELAQMPELCRVAVTATAGELSLPEFLHEDFRDWQAGRNNIGPRRQSDTEQIDEDGHDSSDELTQREEPTMTIEDVERDLYIATEDGSDWLAETRDLLLDKRQLIFQGPPGTGKTYIAQKLAAFLTGNHNRVELVQFHPGTAYEDFIQGLRPDQDSPGSFRVVDGPLMRICASARQRPDRMFVLIIDEINRANLPAVFGELYFLLEYRDHVVTMTYGGTYTMPKNLFIIGTMNTADRSITSVDAALRRRFVIRDLRPGEPPMDGVLDTFLARHNPRLAWLSALLAEANDRIGDPDQYVGPSHFLRNDLTETWARRAWDHTVLPTLREHFYGQPERVARLAFDDLKMTVTDSDDADAD